MVMQRIGAVAVAVGLIGVGVAPVSAQTGCRQIQIATTRTSSPLVLTPLDAIAFPVSPAPAASIVVRQIVVCPAGSAPPVPAPFPLVIGTPIFGAPFVETPVVAPVVTVPAIEPSAPSFTAPAPAAPPRAAGGAPAAVGAVPEDTVRALATRSARYDRMVVTVAGTAAAVEQTTDARGAPVTTFRLESEGTSVGVVVWGHVTVRPGEAVRVSGPFYVSTPFMGPSGDPWHDVVEADLLQR